MESKSLSSYTRRDTGYFRTAVWYFFYGNADEWYLIVMAEFIDSGKKSGKRSTRVDLTPMVDLGFLLITFFIFTTALSKPTGLKIYLPKSVPDNIKIKTPESGVLTILLAGDKKIYYYEGADPRLMHSSDLNAIRNIIIDKRKRTSPEKLMVIIKPGREAIFHSLVSIMDEMAINGVKHYAMVDPEPVEYELIGKKSFN